MLCCSHAHSCSFNYKQRTKEPAIFLSWVQHRERTDKNFLMSESEEDDFRRRLLCRLEAISTDYACGLGKYRTTRVKSSACDWCGANRLSCSHCKCASRESKESNTWTKTRENRGSSQFPPTLFCLSCRCLAKGAALDQIGGVATPGS